MSEEKEKLNLVQKLAKIREISDAVTKSKSGYGYKYADITEILAKVTAGMKKYHVSLIPEIAPGTFKINHVHYDKIKTAKDGTQLVDAVNEYLVDAEMTFRWIDEDNLGDFISVPWHLVGAQNDPSQAMGSALTYTTRYFLIEYFQIATPDNDVDAYRSKQKEAEELEEKTLTENLIGEFDSLIREYMVDNSDKSEEIKDFIGKYIKGSNYTKIKDSKTAGRLLNDFKNTYLLEKEADGTAKEVEAEPKEESKTETKAKRTRKGE